MHFTEILCPLGLCLAIFHCPVRFRCLVSSLYHISHPPVPVTFHGFVCVCVCVAHCVCVCVWGGGGGGGGGCVHVGVCSACICVCVYFHSSYGCLESLLFDFELFLIFDTEMIMLEYGSGESELSCKM